MIPSIIRPDNKENFRNLASKRIFNMIGGPGILSVGCSEAGLATGLMVCKLDGDETVEVIWLFVAEEERRKGVASLLVETVCNTMRSSGYRTLYLVASESKLDDSIKKFIAGNKFSTLPITEDFTTVTVENLYKALNKGNYSDGNCFPIKEIPVHYLNSFLEKMTEEHKEKIAPLLDRSQPLESYHPCSCGYIREKKLKGLLLFNVRESNDGVTLTCIMNGTSSPVSLIQMLRYSARIALEICPKGAIFSFATMNGLGASMLEYLGAKAMMLPIICAFKTFE